MTKPDEQQMRDKECFEAFEAWKIDTGYCLYECGEWTVEHAFQAGAAWQQSRQSAETDEAMMAAVYEVLEFVDNYDEERTLRTTKEVLSALGCLPSQVKELREEVKKWKAEAKHQTKGSQKAASYLGKYLDEDARSRNALMEENARLKNQLNDLSPQ